MVPDTITLNITQEDIDGGKPSEPCGCPVFLAAQRQFKDAAISVGIMSWQTDNEAVLHFNDERYSSEKLTEFVNKFDFDEEVVPCQITVRHI